MSFEAAFQDGLTAVKASKSMIARLQFEQVTELAPDYAPGWLWLAWTSDTPEQAEAHLRKALELDDSNQLARAFLEVTTALKDFEVGTDYSTFSVSGATQPAAAVEPAETAAVE